MAKRTDRQRVKEQADRIIAALDNAIEHAKTLHYIADGRSGYIEDKVPVLVTGIGLAKDLAEHFKRGL